MYFLSFEKLTEKEQHHLFGTGAAAVKELFCMDVVTDEAVVAKLLMLLR